MMYKIKAKCNRTATTSARYGHKTFRKGRTYEIRRKLTPSTIRQIRNKKYQKEIGWKVLSIKKI